MRPSWPGPLSRCWRGWGYARYRCRAAFIEARVGIGASTSWQLERAASLAPGALGPRRARGAIRGGACG
eukprot:3012573-Lingulodinium_polyedra.AAC.1